MAFCGIWIDDRCFDLLAREASFGGQRRLDEAAVTALKDFAKRYERLHLRYDAAAALALGRDFFRWLDGESSALKKLRDYAPRPFAFEVRGPRSPAAEEWALLRAPFELLADAHGFLAEDARLQFAPMRRLGSAVKAPPLSDHRLGLVFMAASPRGQQDLDYEAEETAILAALTPERIDLVGEESGNPDLFAERLAKLDAMQALYLSCHDHKEPSRCCCWKTSKVAGVHCSAKGYNIIGCYAAGTKRLFCFLPIRSESRPRPSRETHEPGCGLVR